MTTSNLLREVALRSHQPDLIRADAPYDPYRDCRHKPSQTYTREPCSCGRELWPPRGRGRGEAISSHRRMEARLRAIDALHLASMGYTYAAIARRLGYKHRASAYNAVQRLREEAGAWRIFEERTGYRPHYREPSEDEMRRTIAALESMFDLDKQRLSDTKARLRRLLVNDTKAKDRRRHRQSRDHKPAV